MGPIRILQWNCRSIWNKLSLLNCTLFNDSEVIVLQETFLSPGKVFSIPGKIIYRLDRLGRPGGGLLIAVNSRFSSVRLPNSISHSGNELFGVSFKIGPNLLNIVNVYSRTGNVSDDLRSFCRNLVGPSVILGDFNLHHSLWGAPFASRYSEEFVEWLNETSFCLVNSSIPTHVAPSGSCSLLDLSICSADLLARTSLQVEEDPFESDHFPVLLSIDLSPPTQPPRSHFRWPRICQEVNSALMDCTSLDHSSFCEIIQRAMKTNTFTEKTQQKSVPAWWNSRCSNLWHQKKFYLRQARRLASTDYWQKYKRTAAKLRQVIKEAKRRFWDSTCQNASDPHILFRVFRKIQNKSSSPPDSHFCITSDSDITFDACTQSEIFVDLFSEVSGHVPIPFTFGTSEDAHLNAPFSMPELVDAITCTRISTPGEDNVSAKLFKGLNDHSLELLLQVYNSIWSSGEIPSGWTSAIIRPISKPGKPKKEASSYRPIALTSVICKICERMIAKRISLHILKNNSLDHRQLGFLPFRDSHTAVTMLHKDIVLAKKEKKFIIGISLDLQAAYDSIYIDGLVIKCAQMGITGTILRWIYNFLSNRQIKVAWRNVMSSARATGKGVPQGAVLSPILFTIFMADFFEALGFGIRCLVFADDIFIYCMCDELQSCRTKLQDALRSVAQWCSYWKLAIRPDKCHAINLSRRVGVCDFDFSIMGGLIGWSEQIKFLGFYIARRGGLRKHVEYIRKKAFTKINVLKALAPKRYGARSHHLLSLVSASIRSLTDYGAAVLHTACPSLFKRLEVLQTMALRVALGLPCWTPNVLVRKHADALPLEARIQDLHFRFWVKHMSMGKWSPFWDFLNDQHQTMEDVLKDSEPNISDIFEEMGCRPDALLQFHFPLQCTPGVLRIYLTDFPFQRTDLNDSTIRSYFRDFMQGVPENHEVFATDASKSSFLTAIAGCSSDARFGYRVHNINSIFTAEALAIATALDELITPAASFILFSDSLSVLSALNSLTIKSPRVILWLHQKLQRLSTVTPSITLCWVPGHRGIPLNEAADKIAKQVKDTDVLLDWISPEDSIRWNRQRLQKECLQKFRTSKYFFTYGDIPPNKSTSKWASNRGDDVTISRLLCKMLITPAMLFRFHLTDNANCQSCRVLDSLEHILFSCASYQSQRNECFNSRILNSPAFSSFAEFLRLFCDSDVFRFCTLKFLRLIDRF